MPSDDRPRPSLDSAPGTSSAASPSRIEALRGTLRIAQLDSRDDTNPTWDDFEEALATVGALCTAPRSLSALLIELAQWSRVAERNGDLHARIASASALALDEPGWDASAADEDGAA